MKVAIIGSRSLTIDSLDKYLPNNITEIISGGAAGVDASAKKYALSHNITITEILPDYKRYGKSAPLKRNLMIIQQADIIVAFWDGHSHGTKYVIDNCKRLGKSITVFKPISSNAK